MNIVPSLPKRRRMTMNWEAADFSAKGLLMAQMAEKLPIPATTDTTSARLIALPPAGMPLSVVKSDNSATKSWLFDVAREVGSACRTAKDYSNDVFNGARNRSRQLWTTIRDGTETVTNEQPLKVLAVVAGVAIVVGVASRIWRSNRYE